jgi:hypothetical protein
MVALGPQPQEAGRLIYLVHRPVSRDVIGMSWAELNEYLAIPDNKGVNFRIETALEVEEHECQTADMEVPRD